MRPSAEGPGLTLKKKKKKKKKAQASSDCDLQQRVWGKMKDTEM